MKKSRLQAYFYLILVSLIWGCASYVIKVTLQGIDPLPFLSYRFLISSVLALPLIFYGRQHMKNIFANFGLVFSYGFLTTTFALGILFLGIDKTTVIDSAIISAMGPLLTAAAGVILLKERITKREKLGMGLAFMGTLITVFGPVVSEGFNLLKFEGNMLVLGYIVVMAVASVLTKKLVRKGVDPLALTNVSFIIGFITLLPFTLFQLPVGELVLQVTTLSANHQLGVFYMAALSGTLAYALWVRGQKSIEISEAGLFAYLIPIFAAPLGIVLLNESLTPGLIVGSVLIVIGVVIAEIKTKRSNS